MHDASVVVGFSVIVVLYAVIGVLAAVGSAAIFRTVFKADRERQCFAAFLVPIAGFYLAFAAYFEAGASSWRTESSAVVVFALLGLLGMRYNGALAMGYCLHGLWDVLHEVNAHGLMPQGTTWHLTEIPLAYGVFCLAYDFAIAAYFARGGAARWGQQEGNFVVDKRRGENDG